MMEDDYKPTRREVFGEMWASLKDPVKSSFSREQRGWGFNLKCYGEGLLYSTIGLCIIPTSVRVVEGFVRESNQNTSEDILKGDVIGRFLGLVTGAAGGFVSIGWYTSIPPENLHPGILAIPIATNMISGAYEIGRIAYKKVENKLVKKRETTATKDLEKSVESA